ncbi:hypothetical protein BD410DRAFT_836375 [Rickenella mellea]|uniref:BTB domain-containing protein n=1 Tax=Rickenella mellea TaxID=50990 RepID=A0A4Y7QHC4_9AGAM|nr:hypothetical protein BD410DRAFT_836375 [Rickenella mellea]
MQENEIQDVICEGLWFKDGSVVIAASVDTSRHLFKVHTSVLSTHSHVFRDLFTLPQPLAGCQTEDMDTYDGLPLVIFPDAPDDIRDLLVALYYPMNLVCRRNRRSTFKKVAGVLRLSTKYEIGELWKHVKGVLDADWPSNFEAWEANELAISDRVNTSSSPYIIAAKPPHSAEIIQLANDCHITSILPAAYYNIARNAPSEYTPFELRDLTFRDTISGH